MWIRRMSLPVIVVAALSAGCQGTGDLFGGSSSKETQPIASNVNGTGTIVSVDTVSRKEGIGLGTLAGAAVGGILGSQVGGGTGRTVATAAGAAGGAYAGREIEKRRAGEIYKVTIRMDDGTTQSFAQEAAPTIKAGDRVQITNGVLTPL